MKLSFLNKSHWPISREKSEDRIVGKPLPKPKKMAQGGDVEPKKLKEKDAIHHPLNLSKNTGTSVAGHHLREGRKEEAKEIHSATLDRMKKNEPPHLYAKGGEITKFIPKTRSKYPSIKEPASDGGYITNPTEAQARSGYAVHKDEGGSVEGGRDEMSLDHLEGVSDAMDEIPGEDDEMMEMVAHELMEAIKSGNKRDLLDAIRAIVMSCKE